MILPLVMSQACTHQNEYVVATIPDGSITVDGTRSENTWSETHAIKSFLNPWDKEVCPETSLFLLKDTAFLFFFFDVVDHQILAEPTLATERDIEKGDRVELFFSEDKGMGDYYCFEIDPKGRTLAYSAKNYRNFDFDWDVPSGFHVAAQRHPRGYTVEGAIPLAFIETLCRGPILYFGAYRAEFSRVGNDTVVENWLTRIDPKTPSPDFHVPTSLGRMKLTD